MRHVSERLETMLTTGGVCQLLATRRYPETLQRTVWPIVEHCMGIYSNSHFTYKHALEYVKVSCVKLK